MNLSCHSFNKRVYKLRWRIESAFNRLKDFRRIATRYDRLASAVESDSEKAVTRVRSRNISFNSSIFFAASSVRVKTPVTLPPGPREPLHVATLDRRAATKVIVFHSPCGTWLISRSPREQRPQRRGSKLFAHMTSGMVRVACRGLRGHKSMFFGN